MAGTVETSWIFLNCFCIQNVAICYLFEVYDLEKKGLFKIEIKVIMNIPF